MTLRGYRVRFQQASLPESQGRLARAVRLVICHGGSQAMPQTKLIPPVKPVEEGGLAVVSEMEVPA